MAQAERDLEHARTSAREGHHEWACFASQQAAEKALKAAHLSHLRQVRTHVITDLLRALVPDAPAIMFDQARVLDGYYLPTRYASGHESGPPLEHYGPLQSEKAIEYAGIFIECARSHVAESR